jgi:hypothetical protein
MLMLDQNRIYSVLLLFFFLGTTTVFGQKKPSIGVTNKTSAAGLEHKKSAKDSVAHAAKGHFIPVPIFITDQNMGYGLILALTYLHPNTKKSTRKDTPPSITAVFGGATSTKTWTAGLAHTHAWNNDKLRYAGALMYFDVNLDFYQLGDIDLSDNPIESNMRGWGTIQRMLFRLGKSDFFIGPQYGYSNVESSLNLSNPDRPIIDSLANEFNKKTTMSALGIIANYDSRDNTISPNKGLYSGIEYNYNATWLGASQEFSELELFFYSYVPINKWLSSIYHFDAQSVTDKAPYYMRPYLKLRGAPVMYYQGDITALVETQWRAMFYKNWGVIGFAGAGKAFNSFSEFSDNEWVINYGTGLRYIMEKAFKTRVGVDFAWANENFGWYIVVGTSF